MNSLEGKPAGSLMIVCPTCGGADFKLLGPAPQGGRIGERISTGKHAITTAECIACGEQCYPFADATAKQI